MAERIADFRARHEPQRAKLVPPHLTLVFGVGEEHLQSVQGLVETASTQTRAFTVTFDTYAFEFDTFEKKHKLFLLCGSGSDQATSLHERLYDGPHRPELSSTHPFRPHMTIATYDTRTEIERVDNTIARELPIKSEIRALELVRFSDGTLTTLETASLLR